MKWQYNGVAKMSEILDWCMEHILYYFWYDGFDTIHFNSDKAYTMFMLKWS